MTLRFWPLHWPPLRGLHQSLVLAAAESTAKTENAQVFIPALTRASGYMETAVDSDNPNSEVVAVIPAGPLAGARLHSPSVKLAGNGLDIKFTSMSWKGMELNVKASAQSEKNLMSSIASDVNHRWGHTSFYQLY